MMDGKPDLRPCPFCGGNAELKTYRDNLRGDTFAAMCQKTDCPGRTYRKRATLKAAIEAWNRRAEPENRVLTLAELEEHCKGGADAAPVWIEYKITKELSRWIYILEPEGVFGAQTIVSYKHNSNWRKRYGTFWRCWLRKPTAEEMANATWEE